MVSFGDEDWIGDPTPTFAHHRKSRRPRAYARSRSLCNVSQALSDFTLSRGFKGQPPPTTPFSRRPRRGGPRSACRRKCVSIFPFI